MGMDVLDRSGVRKAIYRAARERIYGIAGDGRGNLQFAPGRIWVRIPGKGITWAWSLRFLPRPDQPVWLEHRVEDGSLEVVDQVIGESVSPVPLLVPHRSAHMEGGADPIAVTAGMIYPLRVVPLDPPGRGVAVNPGVAWSPDGPVALGRSIVLLSDFEIGESVWIVIRNGQATAARDLNTGDTPLALVTVQEFIGWGEIQDRRIFPDSMAGSTSGSADLPPARGDLSGDWPDITVVGLRGRPVASTAPSSGQALRWDGTQWSPSDLSASGDVSGNLPNLTVVGLRGRPVANTAPSSGQVLQWTGSQWEPQNLSRGVIVRMSADQTISSGTWTKAALNTVVTGDSSMLNSTNYTITIPESGKWIMCLNLFYRIPAGLTLTTNPFRAIAAIQYKRPNETTSRAVRQEYSVYYGGASMSPTFVVVWIDNLPANTVIKAGTWQNSGANLTIWGGSADSTGVDGETITYFFTQLSVWKLAP